jgi:hypothetical protein
LPIIRVTKAQIEKANKARKDALLKDPEFRAYDERQQLWLQTTSKQSERIMDGSQMKTTARSNDSDCRPCDKRQRREREAGAETEQDQ